MTVRTRRTPGVQAERSQIKAASLITRHRTSPVAAYVRSREQMGRRPCSEHDVRSTVVQLLADLGLVEPPRVACGLGERLRLRSYSELYGDDGGRP